MKRSYLVVEHHYRFKLGGGLKSWTYPRETVTNIRETVNRLVKCRCVLSTMARWTIVEVGTLKVKKSIIAQQAVTMYDRQMAEGLRP